jgi:hypothetical protein
VPAARPATRRANGRSRARAAAVDTAAPVSGARTDERAPGAVALTWTPAPPSPAGPYLDRRAKPKRTPDRTERRQGQRRRGAAPPLERRRSSERRGALKPTPFPDRRLTRSAYEKVFLKLVSGGRLRIGRQTWTPVGMKGWYHAIFRNDANGRERLITIDQLLKRLDDWE